MTHLRAFSRYLFGLGNGMKVTPGFGYLESELHSPQEQCFTIMNYGCKKNNVRHFANVKRITGRFW